MGCQEAVNHGVTAHSVGVKGQERAVDLSSVRDSHCDSLLHTQHGCESDLSGGSGNSDYLRNHFRRSVLIYGNLCANSYLYGYFISKLNSQSKVTLIVILLELIIDIIWIL